MDYTVQVKGRDWQNCFKKHDYRLSKGLILDPKTKQIKNEKIKKDIQCK